VLFVFAKWDFADSHPSRTNEEAASRLTQVNANGTLVDLVRHDGKEKTVKRIKRER
jgi:hypothetical protein